MLKRFHNLSLIRQFMILIILLLVVLLFSYIICNNVAKGIIARRAMDSDQKILLQVQDKITSYYADIDAISNALLYSPTTQNFILQEDVLGRILNYDDVMSVFSNTMTLNDNIKGIWLYDKSGKLLANEGESDNSGVRPHTVNDTEYSTIFITGNNKEARYTITIPVYNLKSASNDYVGECIFVMSTGNFSDLLQHSLITDNSGMLLLDRKDNVIASIGKLKISAKGISKLENSNHYFIQDLNISQTNWHLVNIIPKNDLLHEMDIVVRLNIITYIVLVGILILFVLLIFSNILRPIDKITHFMNAYPHSGLKRRYPVAYRNEVDTLARNMNKMLDDIDSLSNSIQQSQRRVYEMQISNTQMQIITLRNQINPHFLYNTLDCIRGMSLYHENYDIADITESLSDMFRYAVQKNNFVTVRAEIDHIRKYAHIIDYRFMGRISFLFNIDENLLNYNILRMLLQPLAENAVFHGLELKDGNGFVRISVRQLSVDRVEILVEDNGLGIEDVKVEQLRAAIVNANRKPDNSGHGIGLCNIYRRLQIFYGNRSGMEITSALGVGTMVKLIIPFTLEEKMLSNGETPYV